jgi:hypothetical protein
MPLRRPLWQLWVNHTLAHVEAKRRGATRAMFAVCAPEGNDALGAPSNLAAFRNLVADRDSLAIIGVNSLIGAIGEAINDEDHQLWHQGLMERYCEI